MRLLITSKVLFFKVFGGFNTTLRIHGFDASVSFDYQIGGKVQDFRYASLMSPNETSNGAGSAIHKIMLSLGVLTIQKAIFHVGSLVTNILYSVVQVAS